MNTMLTLVTATGITVSLSFCSLIVGLILALIFAIWESTKYRIISLIGSMLVMIVRGLPEILVVFFIYFGLSQLLFLISEGFTINFGIIQIFVKMEIRNFNISPFFCGTISLSLLYAAYASQTIRGALKIIPIGQWESGKALGLSRFAIFFRLIMPQVWHYALPGLGNQWLVLLKDTALVSFININDLMLQTKNIATYTQEPFIWNTIAALIYLVMALLSRYILKKINLQVKYPKCGNLTNDTIFS